MSRTAANIDDFVKGRMSGAPLETFQESLRNNADLAQTVRNQQMVSNVMSRQNNADIRAEIQQVRGMYENQMLMSRRKVDKGSSKPEPETAAEIAKTSDAPASVIRVILYVENIRVEVQEVAIQLKQEVDQIGRVSSKAKDGRIVLKLPVLQNDTIFSWMVDSTKKLSGELSYIGSDGKESKCIEFKDAFCVAYKLSFSAFDTEQVKQNAVETITIVPRKISFRGSSFEV